jgi:hypothetical protein
MKNSILTRKSLFVLAIAALIASAFSVHGCTAKPGSAARLKFAISFPAEKSKTPLDGRMLLMIAKTGEAEPRSQINDGNSTQLLFGIDVDGLLPGQDAVIDAAAFGYPLKSLSEIPAGEYYVQGLLNRYETFHLSDGRTIKLPPDKGEGQRWNAKPGNLYSTTRKIALDPAKNDVIKITLDQEIPPIPPPQDTKYIKHERIRSKLLTEFWGRPMEIGACILLPEGFETHPNARSPRSPASTT